MKKSIILIMSLLCALAHISAQDTYTARVVDATTGDALPMASVYISSSHSTITNQEGDFSIKAHPEDMLHITYVGYNGKNIKASDLGRKVALKPYTRLLKEVIVTPIDIEGLLKKLTKKLNDEYNKFSGIQSNYFFRQVTQNDTTYNELIEAFFRTRSDIALREFMLTTGRYGNIESGDTLKPFYKFRDYYKTSCIAPMLPESGIWRQLYTPLPYEWIKHYYEKLYDLSYAILQGEDSTRILLLQFDLPSDRVKANGERMTQDEMASLLPPTLTGRLMIDMDKLRLLSFRGMVRNQLVKTRFRNTKRIAYSKRNIEIQMTYTHNRGFDEVASIGTRMLVDRGKDDYRGVYWSTMFNIGDYDIGEGVSTRWEDIYYALRERGNDETFREHYKIVKTTSTEEAIIKEFERDNCFGSFIR